MAYAYQGPLFDPNYTLWWVRDVLIGKKLLGWMRGWSGSSWTQWVTFYPLLYALYVPVYLVLNLIWFRKLKR